MQQLMASNEAEDVQSRPRADSAESDTRTPWCKVMLASRVVQDFEKSPAVERRAGDDTGEDVHKVDELS